jgi:hypothetical protein
VIFTPSPAPAPSELDPAMLCIGRAWHDVSEVCVDPVNGSVWALDFHEGQVIRTFMNSSADKFHYFLDGVTRQYERYDAASYTATAIELVEELSRLDPFAVADGSWWTAILEEMITMV